MVASWRTSAPLLVSVGCGDLGAGRRPRGRGAAGDGPVGRRQRCCATDDASCSTRTGRDARRPVTLLTGEVPDAGGPGREPCAAARSRSRTVSCLPATSSTPRDGAVLDLGCEGPNGFAAGPAVRGHSSVSAGGRPRVPPDPSRRGVAGPARAAPRAPPGVDDRVTVRRPPPTGDAEPAAQRRRPGPGAAAPRAAGPRRAAVAGRRLPRPHGALRRRPPIVDSRRSPWPGLDFLAVTDHNTASHHAYLPSVGERYGITLLPGQEVTTDRGHANAFGTSAGSTSDRGAAVGRGVELRRRPVDEPPAGGRLLLADGARPPDNGCGDQALVVAHAAGAAQLGWSAGVVTVLGPRHGPRRWERLPRIRQRRSARSADDLGPDPRRRRPRRGGSRTHRGQLRPDWARPLPSLGDELVALSADGLLLLSGFDAGRRPVVGDRAVFRVADGPWWLEDDQMRVQALCG